MSQALLSTIRDLTRRKARERRGLTRAEGVRLVEEAVEAGIELHGAVVAESLHEQARGAALLEALRARNVTTITITDQELEKLADTDTPQGIIAIIAPPRWALHHITVAAKRPVLILDAVQDPGNVGTLVRTAAGLGAAGVIALPGTAELANPKVVRSAMGASFQFPAVSSTLADCQEWIRREALTVWVGDMEGRPARDVPRPDRLGILVGNEGRGVSAGLFGNAEVRVGIPLAGGTESLNVAIAAAILLYEAQRD